MWNKEIKRVAHSWRQNDWGLNCEILDESQVNGWIKRERLNNGGWWSQWHLKKERKF